MPLRCFLYSIVRVNDIEKTPEFAFDMDSMKTKREKLKEKSKSTIENKKNKLKEYINSLKIDIPSYNKKTLFRLAINNYNNHWEGERFADKNSTEEFLERISVNFLRHSETQYHEELDRLFGKVGKDEGYILLKFRVLSQIQEKYDFLSYEVSKQIERIA